MKKRVKGYPCLKREDVISHWSKISHIDRAIGHLTKISKMIKDRKWDCYEIINQLLAVSGECRGIARWILGNHSQHCLREDCFPGSEEDRNNEKRKALQYLSKVVKSDREFNQIFKDLEKLNE